MLRSLYTTSVTSNNFIGSGIFLLAEVVFRSPDKRLVRATWNSNVFGLLMHTVRSVSNGLRSFVETSSLEHYKKRNH